jgi:DNA-binding transcriptional LysR family regulator
MMALAHLSGSDLIAALPRRLVRRHATQFGLVFVDLPFKRKADSIEMIVSKAAMRDAAVAWLIETTVALFAAETTRR